MDEELSSTKQRLSSGCPAAVQGCQQSRAGPAPAMALSRLPDIFPPLAKKKSKSQNFKFQIFVTRAGSMLSPPKVLRNRETAEIFVLPAIIKNTWFSTVKAIA